MEPVRIVEPTDVLWRRIGASLIDMAGLVILTVAAFVLLPAPLALAVVLAGAAAAFVLLQGRSGASPGKHVVGLRVVDADGRLCDERAALTRTLAWAVDGFPYVLPLVGYTAAFGDRHGQRLGDRMARTYVVDRRFVGHPPFTVAVPGEGGPARLLTTRAAYRTDYANPVVRTGGYAGATAAAASGLTDPPAAAAAATPAAASAVDVTGATSTLLALPASTTAGFDPEVGGFLRWDEVHQTWAVFDEDARVWRAVGDGRPAPTAVGR